MKNLILVSVIAVALVSVGCSQKSITSPIVFPAPTPTFAPVTASILGSTAYTSSTTTTSSTFTFTTPVDLSAKTGNKIYFTATGTINKIVLTDNLGYTDTYSGGTSPTYALELWIPSNSTYFNISKIISITFIGSSISVNGNVTL